ncbi:MAG TPA: aminotransferase class III-fold pyridoxal phosphate-dependent enzyme [Ilumatobacteraceae bacterium]|nr:aminotransferase class III-fold pyridoxal phosphate-dependent enzyme [Ilumatobacteraceae bacterium]
MTVLDTHPEDAFANDRAHVFHSWSAQGTLNPLVVSGAEGSYFWTQDGTRYLDFSSQLVNVNIGHQHPRLVAAIKEQADQLCTVAPFHANDARSEAARLICEVAAEKITDSQLDMVFFTNGGAEATENAVRMARLHTGRGKVLTHYRSYHGGTNGAIMLTGDPRRWPSEPGMPGVVKFWGPYPYRSAFHSSNEAEECERALAHLDDVLMVEGSHTVAAILVETVVGTNGILVPPDGFIQGIRALCDKYGILMIGDEVMAGFGRTGKWFSIEHWNVVPDIMTMAKGLTSAYVQLGAVGMRRSVADAFKDKVFYGGLTYNSHPLACAAALATLQVYEEDKLIENARRMGVVMRQLLDDLARKHPSVGAARSIGLFGLVELVRDRAKKTPLAPFNGTSEEMAALSKFFRQEGLYTFVRWHTFFTNPPLCITEAQLREAFEIIDRGLEITDRAVA